MKIKKYILLCIVFVMSLSVCILPFSAAAAEKISADVLKGLEILPKSEVNMQKEITRAEAARYMMGFLKMPDLAVQDTVFYDVTKEHMLSGFIHSAETFGIVSRGEYYRPDEKILGKEFIKMIVSALGYDEIAKSMGGYPDGYVFAAQTFGVLDGVVLEQEKTITLSDAVILLGNALNAPISSEIITEDKNGNINIAYEKTKKSDSYLYKKMGIRVFDAYVEEISAKDNSIAVTLISEKTESENKDYVMGKTYKFYLGDNTSYSDVTHADVKLWIDSSEKVVCITLSSDILIKYAYIDEVNEVHNITKPSEVREIKNLALIGMDDYVDVSENCKFYYNGNRITKGAKYFTGAFAKAIIKGDEIVCLEAYEMKDGGIVTEVDNGLIKYKNGKWDDKEYKSFSSLENINVVVNGEPSNYWAIVPEMLFDYCEYEDSVLFVVSSRSVTDVFGGKAQGRFIIGDEDYYLSENFPLYLSDDGVSYINKMTEDDLLGDLVTAHLDFSGRIRYMHRPIYNEETSEFYGFVLGYDEDSFSEEVKFKVCRVYDDRTEEMILTPTKTVKKTSEYIKMKNAALALYASGTLSENLKANNDIVWRIRAVNGKIVSLKEAELFDQNPKDGITSVTYIPGGTVPYISSPRIYFDGAVICALFYDDYLGKVTSKILTFEDIRDKTFSNVRIDFYNDPGTSDIRLALFRGDVKTIATNRADLINIGIMELKSYTTGKEGMQAAEIKILDDGTYKVPQSSITEDGRYFYVKYAKNAAIADESPINIVETVSLDGSPYTWTVNDNLKADGSVNAVDGLYTDVVTRQDGRRVFFETQDLGQQDETCKDVRYYLNVLSDYYVYRLTDNPNNRFEKVTINEVEPGMRVWYGLRNSIISFIIVK